MFRLLIASLAVVNAANIAPVMKLRGGMSLGPITPGNFNGVLQTAAAITAADAISQKYGGLDGTSLGSIFAGGVWNTNLLIALTTGVASTVVYSIEAASTFETAKLTAVLWLLSVGNKLKGKNFDFSSLMDDKVETVVAVVATYLAFA